MLVPSLPVLKADLKLLCGLRVVWSPIWMDLQRHFVVILSDVCLTRLFVCTQNLVQVGGVEQLPTPLEQTHRTRTSSGLTG